MVKSLWEFLIVLQIVFEAMLKQKVTEKYKKDLWLKKKKDKEMFTVKLTGWIEFASNKPGRRYGWGTSDERLLGNV